MSSERNPNFPNGVIVNEDGTVQVFYPGFDYRPELSEHTLEIKTQDNGHGEEIVYVLNPKAPVATWTDDTGVVVYKVELFIGNHSKYEEGFCLYPILICGHDEQIGDYTEAWSVKK